VSPLRTTYEAGNFPVGEFPGHSERAHEAPTVDPIGPAVGAPTRRGRRRDGRSLRMCNDAGRSTLNRPGRGSPSLRTAELADPHDRA
jgi:hypothetical protein